MEANYSILSDEEKKTAQLLVENDQAHLFAHWPAPGKEDAEKHRFLKQCALIESAYLGGIKVGTGHARSFRISET